jgi:biotin transport system permease protein
VSDLALYTPGRSPVHRLPAGLKLSVLAAFGIALVWLRAPWQIALAAALVATGYAVSGLGIGVLGRQLRVLVWFLLALGVYHLWATGWERAVVVVGSILVLVLAAGLVTLTTRTTDLTATITRACRPLRRVGVDPARVGLVLALGIRAVPLVVSVATEVREAQRARGVVFAPRAYVVAVVVRSLRRAEQLGDALVARGLDD